MSLCISWTSKAYETLKTLLCLLISIRPKHWCRDQEATTGTCRQPNSHHISILYGYKSQLRKSEREKRHNQEAVHLLSRSSRPLACKTVTEIEARKRIVKEKQACFNCLGNHRVADCKSDKTCKNCNKRHHTSICSKNGSHLYTKSKDSSTSKPDTDAAVASMHSSTSSVRSQVLLKTAIAPITYDKTHFNTANILFDEGAQRSFITQEMADLLNLRPHRKEAITISGFGESNKKNQRCLRYTGNIINDQENRGFIEKVETPDETTNRVHYIPHHPVKKDSSTTPIRIVYDCSCRQDSESPSLNDCLSSTPPQLNKLTDILTRFRYGKYALTTDIEKAFLQIGLDEEDRDSTRFFWLRDPSNPKSELETYRFKVILFGATCSPFILNATLLKHLSTVKSATAEILKRDLYVDNVLTSVNTEEAALNFFEESRELMTNAGFNLRTWKSNSNQLSNEATKANVLDTDSETKILGMRWDAKSDILTFAKLNEDRPSWISDENSWPTWTPQVKQETLLLTTTDDSEKTKPCELNGISKIIDLSRFSSLKKLLRVTCYVFKFVNICKSKRPYNLRKYARHGKDDITKDEIDSATSIWITDIQNVKFSSEKEQLVNPSRDKNLPLVRQLRLFIDTEGVIRCAGRIHNSQLDDSAKFPVLLPKKNQFTDLVILNAHLQMLHSVLDRQLRKSANHIGYLPLDNALTTSYRNV
ncbi:Hypothetical predicted protein [Mytilus galloprovincialis]|uniref:Reverse transcriptase domain-containing protein n=1 Tax=Mytilus galloprovincialis TaxID=29158 RepID=A0A8B6FCA6_MYTGA|nr:Hypothetical predicted protein [Mytilus galloprovincialis]